MARSVLLHENRPLDHRDVAPNRRLANESVSGLLPGKSRPLLRLRQPQHARPPHQAIPGFVYGGLLASLIDCHSTGTAAAAMYRNEGREMDSLPAYRFVTGSLQVSYLKPTPLGRELEIRGRVKEIKGRKVVVECSVFADGVATARGEVVAVQMPENFGD